MWSLEDTMFWPYAQLLLCLEAEYKSEKGFVGDVDPAVLIRVVTLEWLRQRLHDVKTRRSVKVLYKYLYLYYRYWVSFYVSRALQALERIPYQTIDEHIE